VIHRVIAAHAPGVAVIDVTHQIPAHDVHSGALTLWRAAPWLVPGVILAVVDPGVGSARRGVAIEIAGAGAVLVGPDNGLLLPAATSLGPLSAAVQLSPAPAPAPPGRGVTFAGRDLFAPAAARLAAGAPMHSLGQPIHPDPAGFVAAPIPAPQPTPDGGVEARVLWVDHFGNAQLNVRPPEADHLGPVVTVVAGHHQVTARRARSYAELEAREVGLVTDSYGLLAISCRGAPAAARLGLQAGDPVWLQPGVGG
jgi:S-adenosylmethionine hydrolase